jgi:hypothetical protein
LGAKLEGGAKWTADEVKKYVSDLGSQIESLGGNGSGAPTSTNATPSGMGGMNE